MRVCNTSTPVTFLSKKCLIFLAFFYIEVASSTDYSANDSPQYQNNSEHHSGFKFDQSAKNFLTLSFFQVLLGFSESEFDLKDHDFQAAAVDNFIYAHMSEMESSTRAAIPEIYLSKQFSDVATPFIYASTSMFRMAIHPLNQHSMTMADMSAFWGLRVGIKGVGQLLSKRVNYAAGIKDIKTNPTVNYLLNIGMCVPASAMATLSPTLSIHELSTKMLCAQAASQYQDTRLAVLQGKNYTEHEALGLCAVENLSLGFFLLTLYANGFLGLTALVYGSEAVKVGCDCTLKVLKHDYLPEKGVQRAVVAYSIEGSFFFITATRMLKTNKVAFEVLRKKMRNGAMFQLGSRLSQHMTTFIIGVVTIVLQTMLQLSPYG